ERPFRRRRDIGARRFGAVDRIHHDRAVAHADAYDMAAGDTAPPLPAPALARTRVLTTGPQANPPQRSPRSGPSGLRALVGFRPNTPEAEAGIRIEPPPRLACATGRSRAATSAAAPPYEPPEECSRFQGLRVGPCRRDSVVGIRPNSGLELLPKIETPVSRKRCTSVPLWSATKSFRTEAPEVVRVPLRGSRSFRRKGTPVKGPSGKPRATCRSA